MGKSVSLMRSTWARNVQPFLSYTVLITPCLKKQLGKSFAELKTAALHGGAFQVQSRLPVLKDNQSTTLVISCGEDPDLTKLKDEGWTCYTKDLIPLTVLRSPTECSRSREQRICYWKCRARANPGQRGTRTEEKAVIIGYKGYGSAPFKILLSIVTTSLPTPMTCRL